MELLLGRLDSALQVHDGRALLCNEGGHLAAFDAPLGALRWCLNVQRSLLEVAWPDALLEHPDAEAIHSDDGVLLYRGLRVKMGLDLGKLFERRAPFSGEVRHGGRAIRRATTLATFAGAGQTVVSVGVHHYIGKEAWAEFEPSVLELHEFCGQTRLSESGFVVLPAELAERRAYSVSGEPLRRSNLPTFHTNFVDRSVELARLAERIGAASRWITLVGPAGAGKTRLAVEFGDQWLEERAGVAAEAWFCDLTAARDVGAALAIIARAVEVQLPASDDPVRAAKAIEGALGGRGEVLMVLDNVEQLAGVEPSEQGGSLAEMIAGWIDAGPGVQIVATSRRSFGHERECVQSVDSMGEDAALALLVDRLFQARGAHVGFNESDHAALREIATQCARLPLAIELVAAGGKLLSPTELLDAWSEHAAARTGSQLEQAIERSWKLLKPWERRAVAQCASFEGGFTVEAAEQVLELDAPEAPPIIEVLEALHSHSLLRSPPGSESATRARLSLYEPVREFVRARQSGEALDAAARRHASYFCEWGQNQMALLDTEGELEAVRRMTEELANLQQALRQCVADEPARAVRLVVALSELDRRIGPLPGQLERVEQAVALAEALSDPQLEILAFEARARARQWLHQHDQARDDYAAALSLAEDAVEEEGDPTFQIAPLIGLASVTHRLGQHSTTEEYVHRALELVEGSTTPEEVTVLQQLGVLHSWRGERDEAARYLHEAQICARRIGNPSALAEVLALYGPAITAHFRYDEAERYMEEALEIFTALGNRRKMVVITFQLAFVYIKTGRPEQAERAYGRALEIIDSAGLTKADRGAVLRGRGEARFWRGHYAQAEADLTEALSLIDAGAVVRALYARLYLAASLAMLDRHAESREHFERAAEQLDETELPTERALARTLEGYLMAALARMAHAEEDVTAAVTALQKAYAGVEAGENSSHTAVQDEAERLRAYLDELVATGAVPALDADGEPDLEVAADARWLEVKGEERVDISRRGALKRILHALVERRLTAPGEPLSLDETLEAGWPGEVIMPEAGARRVYTTINRMRDLGLQDILVTTDDGYMLEPTKLVRRDSQ
ncbi:tetratricopeptide repeat protein [Persicimonas caeni]|uniref:tetratricopeptide repeat protein n=1 Tax=Persicimonas caeni TaxID=2292766 RepID=UPI00143D4A79|nr:tetratricopeptide repeat protein [Persicimonas caeni]